jgi:hypothetical protein
MEAKVHRPSLSVGLRESDLPRSEIDGKQEFPEEVQAKKSVHSGDGGQVMSAHSQADGVLA